jgi:hypothetical protein
MEASTASIVVLSEPTFVPSQNANATQVILQAIVGQPKPTDFELVVSTLCKSPYSEENNGNINNKQGNLSTTQ